MSRLFNADFWILQTGNTVFYLYMGFFALLFLLLHLLTRHRTADLRRRLLAGLMLFTCFCFVLYKIAIVLDKDYSAITEAAGVGEFSIWKELPLQLCNMNMLIIPYALRREKRTLLSFSFFTGPMGALMALLMPSVGFTGYSLFTPRILFFFGIHWMIFFSSVSLVTMKLYTPVPRDIPRTLLTVLELELAVFLFNSVLRLSGLCAHANYWFCSETAGNPLLELFYKLLPYPFLYTLPAYPLLAVYMLLLTGGIALCRRKSNEEKEQG